MLRTIVKNWRGAVEIDGTHYDNSAALSSDFDFSSCTHILLCNNEERSSGQNLNIDDTEYIITVRQYMTKPGNPSFDFMTKMNNDIPMPLRTMVGTIEKETPGMYKMKLHADTKFRTVPTCMKCGKAITNPVSQFFGLGPECGGHNYVNPFNTDEELDKAVEVYKREYLSKIEWEGWVIKSAITEMEEVE